MFKAESRYSVNIKFKWTTAITALMNSLNISIRIKLKEIYYKGLEDNIKNESISK